MAVTGLHFCVLLRLRSCCTMIVWDYRNKCEWIFSRLPLIRYNSRTLVMNLSVGCLRTNCIPHVSNILPLHRSNASTILICHDAHVFRSWSFFLFLSLLLGWNLSIFCRIESTDSSKRTENGVYLAFSNHWHDKAIRPIDSADIKSEKCVRRRQCNVILLDQLRSGVIA